jgi:hypothetical protein
MKKTALTLFLGIISSAYYAGCSPIQRSDIRDRVRAEAAAEEQAEQEREEQEQAREIRERLEEVGSTLPAEAAADPAIATCFPFLQYEDVSLRNVLDIYDVIRAEYELTEAQLFTEHRRVIRSVGLEFSYCLEKMGRDRTAAATERRIRSQFPRRPNGPEDGDDIVLDFRFIERLAHGQDGEHHEVREKVLASLMVDHMVRNLRAIRQRHGVRPFFAEGLRRNNEDRISEFELIGDRANATVSIHGPVAVVRVPVFRADHPSTQSLMTSVAEVDLSNVSRIVLDLRASSGRDVTVVDRLVTFIRESEKTVVAWTDALTREGAELLIFRLRQANHPTWIFGRNTLGAFFEQCPVALPNLNYHLEVPCRRPEGLNLTPMQADLFLGSASQSQLSLDESERLYSLGVAHLGAMVRSRSVLARVSQRLRQRRESQTRSESGNGRVRPPRTHNPGDPIGTGGRDTGSVRNPRPIGRSGSRTAPRVPTRHQAGLSAVLEALNGEVLTLEKVIEVAPLFPEQRADAGAGRSDDGGADAGEGGEAAGSAESTTPTEGDEPESAEEVTLTEEAETEQPPVEL